MILDSKQSLAMLYIHFSHYNLHTEKISSAVWYHRHLKQNKERINSKIHKDSKSALELVWVSKGIQTQRNSYVWDVIVLENGTKMLNIPKLDF